MPADLAFAGPLQVDLAGHGVHQRQHVELAQRQRQLLAPVVAEAIEQFLDHAVEPFAVLGNLVRQQDHPFRVGWPQQQLGAGADHGQGIAHVVRQAGRDAAPEAFVHAGKFAYRFADAHVDRVVDDLPILAAQGDAGRMRDGGEAVAEDLVFLDHLFRPVIGHARPFIAMHGGHVAVAGGVFARVARRQCFGQIIEKGGQSIDEYGREQLVGAAHAGAHALFPGAEDGVAHGEDALCALQWMARAGLAIRLMIRGNIHLNSLTGMAMLIIVCA